MKKLLLALGSIAAVAAPVASVVACGAPKQKHIPLDKSVVTKQLPDMKKALETATSAGKGNSGPTFDNGVVDEDGTGFKVTFTPEGQTTDHIVITVNVDGTIKEVKGPAGLPLGPDFKTKLGTLMQDATVDHSGDSIDTSDFDVTTLDATIVQELKDSNFEAPVLAAGADHQTISDYNEAVDVYMHKYHTQIADDALAIMESKMQLKITAKAFGKVDIPDYKSLDADLMKKIGFPDDVVAKLTKLISLGADIQVTHKVGESNDLAGTVSNTSNGGSINWSHGTSESQILFAPSN